MPPPSRSATAPDTPFPLQRTLKQLENARQRLDRTTKQIEEKRRAGQHSLDSLRTEYEAMAEERKGSDKQVEEVRRKIDGIKRKVSYRLLLHTVKTS